MPASRTFFLLNKPVLTWFQMSRAFQPVRGTRVGRRSRQAGLHYSLDALRMPTSIRAWHRHYDPTLGRYTQPDPLGFVEVQGKVWDN